MEVHYVRLRISVGFSCSKLHYKFGMKKFGRIYFSVTTTRLFPRHRNWLD